MGCTANANVEKPCTLEPHGAISFIPCVASRQHICRFCVGGDVYRLALDPQNCLRHSLHLDDDRPLAIFRNAVEAYAIRLLTQQSLYRTAGWKG